MTTKETIELFDRYVIPNYKRSPIVIVKGKGSRVWDADGAEYLDLFPGWAVNGLGHCHPRVVKAIQHQAARLIHVANVPSYNEPQGKLARWIFEKGFGGKCFFCNSGAEAVEAAIKLTRIHTPQGRYKIITMYGSFHGRTLGAMTATAQPKKQTGFEPLPAGFVYVPFNNLGAVEKAIDDETAGIMVEPIQSEGGINVGSPDYVKGLRELADKHDLVLVFDEVSTGLGRLGHYFASGMYGVKPDIMTLAKALGGGVAIGAISARPDVAASLVPGSHASTFGGNPLAAAAACAVFDAIETEGLLENARVMGERAKAGLEKLVEKYPFATGVRAAGLMLGLELDRPGADIVARAMEKGLLMNCTQEKILRLLPAINVTAEEIDEGLEKLDAALAEES